MRCDVVMRQHHWSKLCTLSTNTGSRHWHAKGPAHTQLFCNMHTYFFTVCLIIWLDYVLLHPVSHAKWGKPWEQIYRRKKKETEEEDKYIDRHAGGPFKTLLYLLYNSWPNFLCWQFFIKLCISQGSNEQHKKQNCYNFQKWTIIFHIEFIVVAIMMIS